MQRVQSDVRIAEHNGSVITSATSLFLNCQGLTDKGKYYIYNVSGTGAIYYNFRPCGLNTTATTYWGSGATATVATGAATGSTFAINGNFMFLEFCNTATGAGSSIIQMSVW